jgi:hypothetical protein
MRIAIVTAVSVAFTIVAASYSAYGGENVALGKPASANSYCCDHIPSNVVDGRTDPPPVTAWNAGDHASPSNPNWWKVDLTQTYPLGQVVVFGSDTQNPGWDNYSVDFALLASIDSLSWDTLGSGELIDPPGWNPESPLRSEIFDFNGEQYRYIQFFSTGGEHWTEVQELQVFSLDVNTAPEATPTSHTRLLGVPSPNPTSRVLSFSLQMPEAGHVHARVLDATGRLVATLIDRNLPQGSHPLEWHRREGGAKSVPNGVYYVRLEALGRTEVRAFVLVR